MSIEAIGAVGAASLVGTAAQASAVNPDQSVFAGLVDQISALNDRMQAGQQNVQALALGQTDNLHQVMMQGEQTRLAFDLLLSVRNKTLDAYQELMRMQI
jgi:flagellar hook-basal body complex protein FliE